MSMATARRNKAVRTLLKREESNIDSTATHCARMTGCGLAGPLLAEPTTISNVLDPLRHVVMTCARSIYKGLKSIEPEVLSLQLWLLLGFTVSICLRGLLALSASFWIGESTSSRLHDWQLQRVFPVRSSENNETGTFSSKPSFARQVCRSS